MIYFVAKNLSMFVGSAVVAVDVVEALVGSGEVVQPVCLIYDIPKDRFGGFSSIRPIQMPHVPDRGDYAGGLIGRGKFLIRSLQFRFNTLKLKKEVKPGPQDLMIFNGYKAPTRHVINQFTGRCKTIQIVHVSPTFIKEFEDAITLDELLEMYRLSDALVFVSDEGRKEWLSYGVLDESKTHYIPNCAREETAKQYLDKSKDKTREGLGLKPDRFYLLSVGSLIPRKGQDLLIEAAPELKKIAPNLEILIIGSGQKDFTESLKEQVRREGMDFVTFLGRKPNAIEYIYASDTFILMSRAEALPVVILESMILKTPVIASDIDGVPEMIEDGETGILFESDNAGDLIQAFEKMYSHSENRNRYAAKASEKYWRYFSKDRFTKRYAELVAKLMEQDS